MFFSRLFPAVQCSVQVPLPDVMSARSRPAGMRCLPGINVNYERRTKFKNWQNKPATGNRNPEAVARPVVPWSVMVGLLVGCLGYYKFPRLAPARDECLLVLPSLVTTFPELGSDRRLPAGLWLSPTLPDQQSAAGIKHVMILLGKYRALMNR